MVRLNDVEQGALSSLYAQIRNSCASSGIEYVPGDDRSLWHFFKTAEFWKDDLLLEPVLILDQFEEILTLQSEARRRDFIDPLSYLVRGVQPERLRVFRSCPLITPKDARSSLQMLSLCPSYGCALRLDRAPFDVPLGHARKTLSL